MFQKTPAQDLEDVRSVMVGLCYCASLFSIPELSDIAPRALLGLHLPGNIEKWSSKTAINGFWEIRYCLNDCFILNFFVFIYYF
jgi:hypothetical protein